MLDLTGFETSNYNAAYENSQLDAFVVSTVLIPRPPGSTEPPVVHWRASALHKHNGETLSTLCEAVTGPAESYPTNMIIKIGSTIDGISPDATIRWCHDFKTPVILSQILTHMANYKMHAFRSDERGFGCLTWVSGLTVVLERHGILPTGSYEGVRKAAESAGQRGRIPGDSSDTTNANFIYPGIL